MLQGQTPSREGPSCLFQPWLQVSWAVAVSLSPVQVCVSPVVAISLCLSLIKTLVLDLGPTWIIQVISSQGPSSHLQRPFLQIRPHSEVLGLGHGHTFWGPSCSPGGCEESASRKARGATSWEPSQTPSTHFIAHSPSDLEASHVGMCAAPQKEQTPVTCYICSNK